MYRGGDMKRKSLLQTIGDTPMIELNNTLSGNGTYLFAKLEGRNPGGSIKDRAALYMIEQAEARGELDKSRTIIEATSGNMGIALTIIGTCKGYRVQIVMSEQMSRERRIMMRALGAELILTDKELGTEGAIQRAREIVANAPDEYWFADQFNNPDNATAHYFGIADEILKDVRTIDAIVIGVGTGGTIMGLARRFREKSPGTRVVGVIPDKGYHIQGLQHPTEDFCGDIYDPAMIDELICVPADDAFETTRRFAATEGLFVGMSSGAALYAARRVHRSMRHGSVVVILPDGGEKYLTTNLFG